MTSQIVITPGQTSTIEVVSPDQTTVELSLTTTGLRGATGGSFAYEQMTPATVWTITHNLTYRPGGVLVVEYGGQNVEGTVSHISANQLTITFAAAISGYAYLS